MNRRDFTKTIAALCCLPGIKLQDRQITGCIVQNSFELEPIFTSGDITIYDFDHEYITYLTVNYSDNTSEKYTTRKRIWYNDPSSRGIDKSLVVQSCCIEKNNLTVQYNGCKMICYDIRRV